MLHQNSSMKNCLIVILPLFMFSTGCKAASTVSSSVSPSETISASETPSAPITADLTIAPSAFMDEAENYLSFLKDELMYFDYTIDSSIRSAVVSWHEYRDGQWTDQDFLYYDRESLRDSGTYAVMITDTEAEFVDFADKEGYTASSRPLDDWNTETENMASAQAFLSDETNIENEQEIVLYFKLYSTTGADMVYSGNDYKNGIKADLARVLTIRYSSQPYESGSNA